MTVSAQTDARWKRAVIAATSSLACLVAIVAIVGAWPVFPDLAFVLLAISMLAAGIAALLPRMAWYVVSLIGAVIAAGGAFAYMTYAISRI